MGFLRVEDIIKATGGRILCGKQTEFSGLSIDSRTIKNGELFIALKGPNFDGNHFLYDALINGCCAIVDFPPSEHVKGKMIIHVKNTLNALHDIAGYIRSKAKVPVISITGTNGKTTTKELLASIFSQSRKVLKTSGNLNNHIGLPLSIARMDGDEKVMVLEMGSNAKGDIRELCEIARPDFAVVTNVGPAHLEGFGSIENVRSTDLEMLDYVKTVSVNADDKFLIEGINGFDGKLITYGIENPADVYAEDIISRDIGSDFRLCFPGHKNIRINLGISGRFNICNALAAASIADALGAELEDIKRGLESFRGVPMRLEIKEIAGSLIISDVYNANPASMEEAVKELARLKRQRAVAVLGDMLELGTYSEEAHRKLLRHLSEMKIDILVAVGPEMLKASSEFSGTCYTAYDSEAARSVLLSIFSSGDTVLVKGSRGMRMENVLKDLALKGEKHAV